jgi:hypothetical protein
MGKDYPPAANKQRVNFQPVQIRIFENNSRLEVRLRAGGIQKKAPDLPGLF